MIEASPGFDLRPTRQLSMSFHPLGSFRQNGGVGFVPPKWRLGSFRQNGGWVRSAKMAVGFVPPKWRPPRTGLSRRVEIPDRELAPRQRAPLVTVDRCQPGGELGI